MSKVFQVIVLLGINILIIVYLLFSVRDCWRPVSAIENDHHAVPPMKDVNMMQKHAMQG